MREKTKTNKQVDRELTKLRDKVAELENKLEQSRKEAQRLTFVEAFYKHILESLPIQMAVYDAEGRYSYLNSASVKNAEISKWLIGKTDFEYCKKRNLPQYIAQDRRDAFDKAIHEHEITTFEEKFPSKNDSLRHIVRSFCPVFDEHGKATHVIGYSEDITKRKQTQEALKNAHDKLEQRVKECTAELNEANIVLKQEISEHKLTEAALKSSEERLRILLENIPDGYYLNDLKGTFLDGNKAAEEIVGYKKDELIGKNFLKLNLLSPGQIPKAVENLAKNALGRPTGPDEFILNRKDGSKVSLEISTFPVKIEDKRVVIGIARDITERKKTEAEFERQQKFIQLVADTATNLIFVKDKDGRFLFANNAMGKAFGTTPEALINKHNAEIHDHPEEVKKYLEDDAEVLRTMRPVEIEETQTLKDGKVLHFQTVKTPLVVDNRTVHILGVSTDITRLKRAEQELREERYRAVVDQSADCIFLADVETGQIVEANTAFQRLLGYSQEEAQKLTFHDFVAHPHEDINERMQRARKQGRLFLGERLYRRKDQTLISVEVNASVVSYSGRKVFCVVSRDMTERKQAEKEIARLKELYSHILDSLPFQIGLFDLDGRFLYVNAAAIKDTDMREWIIGKTHIDYCRKRKISEEIGRRRFEAIQKCIQLREIVSYEEKFPSRHKMGYRDFIRHFSPVINAAGEVIQVIGYSVEITEQKHSEAAQKKLEAQMQHAQKLESLGVLAGGIAHDFNNLLTGILGNAQLAQLEITEASPACENLADIEKAATCAADLCRQLLAYSGKGRFVVKQIHLNEVIKELAHLLKISISKNVALEYHLHEDLPAIEADAAQMHQVIMNLIINASEAIKEENGIVTLRTGIIECDRECLEQMFFYDNLSEGQYVFAEIADSGCGIDEETQKKIFDPFFTTKFTGRGLGMAAVLGIVRSHNGAIKIESAPEEGTTVRILFPASDKVADISKDGVENTQKIQGAGTILVVDDEEVVRKMGRRILECAGFTVLTAEDGCHGIETFRRKTAEIVLVLLDLTMPRMNGEQTLREIHAIRRDVPVILLSGYSEQEAFKHSHHLRWSGFIQKPFQVDALMAKVDEVLKR